MGCNELSQEVVEACIITMFKKHLERFIDKKGLEEYGLNASKWD